MKWGKRRVLALALLLCGLSPRVSLAQMERRETEVRQPQVRFGAEVDYVELTAVVTHERGVFVDDLSIEDFEVLEDGKRQDVSNLVLFAPQTVPPELRGYDGKLDAIASNLRSSVYAIVLDDLNTSPATTPRVRAAAMELIEQHLRAGDLAAVLYTSEGMTSAPGFTSNRRALAAAAAKFVGRRRQSSARTQAELDGLNMRDLQAFVGKFGKGVSADELERTARTRRALHLIGAISQTFAATPGGRKSILYIGEGFDYDIYDVFGSSTGVILEAARNAIGAATAANVTIYTVDPRGVTNPEAELFATPAPVDGVRPRSGAALDRELRLRQDSLRVMAAETGGLAIYNRNDLSPGLDRVTEDTRRYYLLGYSPTNSKRDGTYRELEVRVNRAGVHVRARKGYLARREAAKDEHRVPSTTRYATAGMAQILESPLPLSSIPLRLAVVPLPAEEGLSRVLLVTEIDLASLRVTERDGKFHDALELIAIARDPLGSVQARTEHVLNLALAPPVRDRMLETGLRVITGLDLPPGQFRMMVAVRETDTGRAGSVFYELDIPRFDAEGPAVSRLVISSTRESQAPLVSATQVPPELPFAPSTRRRFSSDDRILILAQIRATPDGASTKVLISTVLKSTDPPDEVVFESTDAREVGPSSAKTFFHQVELPLAHLKRGTYLLEVSARRVGSTKTKRRLAVLEVL